MAIHQHAVLEATLYFWFGSNDTSGSGDDGASPACDVRLAGATISDAPILSPTPELISNAGYPDGCYEVAVAATTGNGFAATNTYAVFCTLAVDGQNPTGFVGSFTLDPIIANVTEIEGGDATDAIQASADDALVANHLDHLFKTTYDPASKPGTADALWNELVESDSGVSRFTANAIEQAWAVAVRVLTANTNLNDPTAAAVVNEWESQSQSDPTGFHVNVLEIEGADASDQLAALATAAKLLAYVQLLARSDAAIEGDLSTELGEINANEGSGAGNFSSQTDSEEAIRDRGDAEWITAPNDPTAATIADAVWDEDIENAHGTDTTAGLLLRVLGSAISDRSFNATLNALLGVADSSGVDIPEQVWSEVVRVLTAGTNLNDFDPDNDTVANVTNVGTTTTNSDMVSEAPTAAQNRDAILDDAVRFSGADIAAILTDTNELQGDWEDGGRLDLLLDSIITAVVGTISEITGASDIPTTPTIKQAIMLRYMLDRNDAQTTASERRVLNNAGSEVLDATMSDDTTTFSPGKLGDA